MDNLETKNIKNNQNIYEDIDKATSKKIHQLAELHNLPWQLVQQLYLFHSSLSSEDQDLYINDRNAFYEKHNMKNENVYNKMPDPSSYMSNLNSITEVD